jgi:chromodomain-helicase-DNA-binding protein 1-like
MLDIIQGMHTKAIFFGSVVSYLISSALDYMHLRGHTYERLDGSVRGNERWLAVEQFSKAESDTFAFLLSTRAGGVGLNLTAASVVIFMDSDFNPQNDLQAQARCLRIGQKKSVSVIRLCCPHTVEEIILARGHGKLRLNSRVLAKGQFSLASAYVDQISSVSTGQLTELRFMTETLTKKMGSNTRTKCPSGKSSGLVSSRS